MSRVKKLEADVQLQKSHIAGMAGEAQRREKEISDLSAIIRNLRYELDTTKGKLVEARIRVHELEVALETANNRIVDLEEPVLVRTTRNSF